jgi:hypothetical protein
MLAKQHPQLFWDFCLPNQTPHLAIAMDWSCELDHDLVFDVNFGFG